MVILQKDSFRQERGREEGMKEWREEWREIVGGTGTRLVDRL